MNESYLYIYSSTISGNNSGYDSYSHVDGKGGGIYNNIYLTGQARIENSTIVKNNTGIFISSPTGAGGGIYNAAGNLALLSTILADNTLNRNSANDCEGEITSLDWNLIETIPAGCIVSGITTHNITAIDPKLGPLTNNGGSTLTHYLKSDSPAIDTGDNAAENCPVEDQRDATRPQDGDNGSTATCDIGAYELVHGEQHLSFFMPIMKHWIIRKEDYRKTCRIDEVFFYWW